MIMRKFMLTGRRRRGIVLVWFALLMVIIVGMVGLALDLGMLVLAGQQLQIGADAAALAGVRRVRSDIPQARADAITLAAANRALRAPIQLDVNTANANDGDIVVGRYSRTTRTFTPQLAAPNAMRVHARRTGASLGGPAQLIFGPMFTVRTADIQREAIAMIGGGSGQAIIVLDADDPSALVIGGNGTLRASGGDIQVNSSADGNARRAAAYFQGSFTLDAPQLNVVGTASTENLGDTILNEGAPPIPDPLAYLPEPVPSNYPNRGVYNFQNGVTYNLQPGYYPAGISSSGAIINFAPGLYIFGGVGMDIQGGTQLYGDGVTFYLDAGRLELNGNGAVQLSPPDPTEHSFPEAITYEGVTVFQARDNTSTSKINGTAGLDLEGTIYIPAGKLDLRGTADKIGNQIIANKIELMGNSDVNIVYDGNSVAPGNRVFLVM